VLTAVAPVLEGTRMRIQYRIYNRMTEPVFAFVRTMTRQGADRDPYVVLRFDPDRLSVSYRKPSTPPGLLLMRELLPFSTRIRPGAVFQDVVELGVPVEELRPFRNPPYPPDPRVVYVTRVDFETQWIRQSETYHSRPFGKDPSLFSANGPLNDIDVALEVPEGLPVLWRGEVPGLAPPT
jgi:hypothetical protein